MSSILVRETSTSTKATQAPAENVPVVCFDMYGTLFSLDNVVLAAREQFPEHAAGIPKLFAQYWWSQSLTHAMAATIVGDFQPFSKILRSTLPRVLDEILQFETEAEPKYLKKIEALMAATESLELTETAREALIKLKASPNQCKVFCFANGSASTTRHLLEKQNVMKYVDGVLSPEQVKKFKPAREAYELIPQSTQSRWLISAHPWDCIGALKSGMCAVQISPSVVEEEEHFSISPTATRRSILDAVEFVMAQSFTSK